MPPSRTIQILGQITYNQFLMELLSVNYHDILIYVFKVDNKSNNYSLLLLIYFKLLIFQPNNILNIY